VVRRAPSIGSNHDIGGVYVKLKNCSSIEMLASFTFLTAACTAATNTEWVLPYENVGLNAQNEQFAHVDAFDSLNEHFRCLIELRTP
jgi:hypothetical protein